MRTPMSNIRCAALALVIALAAAPLEAQTRIGLKLGIGAATLSGDETRAGIETAFDGTRYGIVPSVDAGIPLGGPLGARIGLGFAPKGGAADVPSSITSGRALTEAKTELGYFQLSALLRAGSDAEDGNLNFGVLAGPYLGFNLSCNVAVTSHDPPNPIYPPVPPGDPNRVPALGMTGAGGASLARNTSVPCGEDGSSEATSSDFGLAFGAGVEVRLSAALGLAFEVLYAGGLSEINDEGEKTSHIVFQTGVVLPIG